MKKMKRIFAWIGIILLVGMYASTLVFALIGSETANRLLRASIGCTILVPVVLYAMQLAYRTVKKNEEEKKEEDDSEHNL